jgi:3-dehydroquinate synthase
MFQTAKSIADLSELVEPYASTASSIVIITDENVAKHWLAEFVASCPSLNKAEVIEIEPGEQAKSIELAGQLWSVLLEARCDREALIINLGGGVVTDLGGFIASTYKRGVDFLNIPTSLMAMVDAAIGGKTGVDHDGIKNSIGTFADPLTTIICSEFLSTLNKDEVKSGFAEMLKYGIIKDQDLWNQLVEINDLNAENLDPYIETCAKIKSQIVSEDVFENGPRKLLNLGHTIGHALESHFIAQGLPKTHGVCVAWGIIIETKMALMSGSISEEAASEIINGVGKFFTINANELPALQVLLPYMLNDKKNKEGTIRFVLPQNIGYAVYDVKLTEEQIRQGYESFQ